MKVAGYLLRGLLVLLALSAAVALVLGIPLGALALLEFLGGEAREAFLMPAIALYLLGFCVPVGLHAWWKRRRKSPSRPFRLPGVAWLAGATLLSIAGGQLQLSGVVHGPFFPFFLLAAILPPLSALGLAAHRLGAITTRRRILAGILSGSLLSTHLTILLGSAVSILVYLLVMPLRDLVAHAVASQELERLFYSPTLALAMVEMALVAPIVEELAKPLGAILLAKRLRGPAEAFLVGMAGGVGFAILENMLYESAGAELWASIASLRAVGGALHPLNAGLVAVGWYGVRNGLPGARTRLLSLYGLAVALHALWNGGLVVLYSGIGAYFFGTESWKLSIYGVGQPGIVLAFMLLEAVLLWRTLFLVTAQLRSSESPAPQPLLELQLERPRRLALWATGALLLVVPVAALYGPLVQRYLQIAMPLQ